MKKIIPFILLGLILSSCAGGLSNFTNLFTSPTPPLPPNTATPQPTVTLIPTQDLFAVSNVSSPAATSLIPAELLATITPIPLPTFSEQFINDMSSTTFFVENVGFKGVFYSDAILYWGAGRCITRNIKFRAYVDDPARTDRVFLFLRLRDKKNTLTVGEWSAGAEMIKAEDGSFNYNVETRHLRRYQYYKEAWIEYELVSVNENLEILGRTQLFDRNVSLAKCNFIIP